MPMGIGGTPIILAPNTFAPGLTYNILGACFSITTLASLKPALDINIS